MVLEVLEEEECYLTIINRIIIDRIVNRIIKIRITKYSLIKIRLVIIMISYDVYLL